MDLANFVDGRAQPPASGQYLEKTDPATGLPSYRIPDSDSRDVEDGVAAAGRAFPEWSRIATSERTRILMALADRIEANLEELARAECIDTGKPLRLARAVDIPRASANFRYFASVMTQFHSEAYRTDSSALNYTLRQPHGVVGLIAPWNLPLYLLSWKIAPALAAGNTAVAKPSELTPATAAMLGDMTREVGLLPGVLNIVHGTGPKVGAALVSHPKVKAISFTGGTVTGAEIAKAAAPQFKKLTLELGGKNPTIVFADADLDEAYRSALRSSFENQGEICLCGSRIFVESSIYASFVERLANGAGALRVGDPLEPDTDQGALISRTHLHKVQAAVRQAESDGGKIIAGGSAPNSVNDRCRNGFFYKPTVITNLLPSCRANQEEIFGPVVSVMPFHDENEVVDWANGTAFGLAASVWTRDLDRAHRMAERLHSGVVWINCWLLRDLRTPFGGMKSSGLGREGGEEALRFFTEPKTVCIKYSMI